MIKRLLKLLGIKKQTQVIEQYASVPMFHIDKHYSDMNRREKREYKRWLNKNNMWDGAEVIERLQKNNDIKYWD